MIVLEAETLIRSVFTGASPAAAAQFESILHTRDLKIESFMKCSIFFEHSMKFLFHCKNIFFSSSDEDIVRILVVLTS